MSYASHDPELYMRLQIQGILAKLGFNGWLTKDQQGEAEAVFEDLAFSSDPLAVKVWYALCDWAATEIRLAEGDYFGGLADDAYERIRDRQWERFRALAPSLPRAMPVTDKENQK